MSRQSYGFRRFAVVRDIEPDREPTYFAMQCSVCAALGPFVEATKADTAKAQVSADELARKTAAEWVPVHRREEPEHFTHRLIQTTPYRLVPGEWA